ncbi:MAG: type IX secretion system membrane protein PorP/SprF [Flavobacteriales bacterium]|nr:type IX secretion system membrane protein PorP/SprF [Flavobacteriales bacterium]
MFAQNMSAQQIAQHSQYMYNYFYVNPGVAGTGDYSPLMFTFRDQWAGFPGAPQTYTLSAHTPINDKMGVGVMMYSDKMEAMSYTGAQLAYAYRIAPTEDSKISFGLSGHFTQAVLKADDLMNLTDPDDPSLIGTQTTFVPDVSFGVYYSIGSSFAGISANNLIQGDLEWGDGDSVGVVNKLVRNYYILAGQKFKIGEKLEFEGSLLLKSIIDAPFQIDANFKATFNELFWGGFSYRHTDAVVIMIGVMKKQFRIGYSYDVTLSDLRHASSGTSEIFMSINFRPFKGGGASASME